MKNHNTTPIETTITKLSHDGRGIASIQGKTTFIENALPGEQVAFVYTKRHNKYDEGKVINIIVPSPDRVEPKCQHFEICGGCALQHMSRDAQLNMKQRMFLEQLKHFGGTQPKEILPPLVGNHWEYRRKARLGAKYVDKKQAMLVGFREKNGRYLADLNRCEILYPTVGNLIEALKILISDLSIYRNIPQIEVAVGDTTTALIFRHMAPFIQDDIQKLIAFAQTHQIELYLQPDKPESIHLLWPEKPEHRLYYQLPTQHLTFAFHPTDFTQINSEINQQMVTRAIWLLSPTSNDRILDLFCGLGNFTLPLAQACGQVIGVEGSMEMVNRAQENAERNRIKNAEFYQANLFEESIHAPWMQQTYDKILLDPPRTGALEIIKQLPRLQAKKILYISCNPATLARDSKELIDQGYQLTKAGIMDMFPHTHHVEAIALFEQ